jgi:hypothetical protein
MRQNLRIKAIKNKTNLSAIVKNYLGAYVDGKIKPRELNKKNIILDDRIIIIVPEETRYMVREKVAKDRTNIVDVVLPFLEDYLNETDPSKIELEQAYADKQLKLFEA